jgi:YegS/Rv2252/BmrU family lipid kinase
MSQVPVIIANPRSGGGVAEDQWVRVAGPLTDGLGPCDVRFTEHAGHATQIAHEEARGGRGLVVAFGGDGTINEVANGLVAAGGKATLGIIPRGTGGDLRRSLDLPRDVHAAARRIRDGNDRRIDLGRVVFLTDDGPATRHFVNVASFGFSAAVATRANRGSKRLGAKASFLGATLSTLLSYDNVDVSIRFDGGEPVRRTVRLGAVGNARFFGGGMQICPGARLDSGTLQTVLVGDLGPFAVAAKLHRLFAGTHLTMPQVESRDVRHLEVASADPAHVVPVELDGETPGRLPATFEVLPGALTLRV